MAKVIAVVGATGAQGGGLVRAILADKAGGFTARAITRNAGSDKAQALKQLGAEVVSADLDDAASVKRAFDGAYGAFCVTNFWEHFSPEKEQAQARNMAQAAKAAGLKHVIWSTLEDVRKWVPLSDNRMPTLHNKWKVPHFDGKGEVDHVFTESGVPTTLLLTSFYWDNFIHFGMGPKPNPDGTLAITLPMGDQKMPGIAAADIGCGPAFRRGHHPDGRGTAREDPETIWRPVPKRCAASVHDARGEYRPADRGARGQVRREYRGSHGEDEAGDGRPHRLRAPEAGGN